MSEAKHTPGPWHAKLQMSRDRRPLGWTIEHANGRIGWSSYATAHPNEGEGPPYEIGGANARLIAAAPDLLDAAIRTIEENLHLADGENCTLNRLKRAVAKATGSEQRGG